MPRPPLLLAHLRSLSDGSKCNGRHGENAQQGTFADDLADVIEKHSGGQDVALIGFSMGGGEIARYLSRHGDKGVSRVALVSSVVPYMLQTDDNPNGVPQETFNEIQIVPKPAIEANWRLSSMCVVADIQNNIP